MPRERILHLTKDDFVVQTFRSGGKGGQNQNKRDTGVRIIHPPSGARGEARDERTQLANKKLAFQRMTDSPTFRNWLRVEHARKIGAVEAWVEEQMRPHNLIVEYAESFPDEA